MAPIVTPRAVSGTAMKLWMPSSLRMRRYSGWNGVLWSASATPLLISGAPVRTTAAGPLGVLMSVGKRRSSSHAARPWPDRCGDGVPAETLGLAVEDVDHAPVGQRRHRQLRQAGEGGAIVERRAQHRARLGEQGQAPLRLLGLDAGRLLALQIAQRRHGQLRAGVVAQRRQRHLDVTGGAAGERQRQRHGPSELVAAQPGQHRRERLAHQLGRGPPQQALRRRIDEPDPPVAAHHHHGVGERVEDRLGREIMHRRYSRPATGD